MTVGVGITTRNRPDILEICLDHFNHFDDKNYHYDIFVIDDNSDLRESNKNKTICDKYNVNYKYNETRLGIAKSKNECIKQLVHYDYIFLFDDDCFPKSFNWDNYYIKMYEEYGIEHLLWSRTDAQEHIKSIGNSDKINIYSNCMGVLMFFTKNAIDILGGFDPRFGLYGFEHAQLSNRANDSGLTNNLGPYVAPKDCHNYIYSMDLDYQWLGEDIPLQKQIGKKYDFVWKSSIVNENREQLINLNKTIWLDSYSIKVDIYE